MGMTSKEVRAQRISPGRGDPFWRSGALRADRGMSGAGLRAGWRAWMPGIRLPIHARDSGCVDALTSFTVAGAASGLHRLPIRQGRTRVAAVREDARMIRYFVGICLTPTDEKRLGLPLVYGH